jgi:hypothetical protein
MVSITHHITWSSFYKKRTSGDVFIVYVFDFSTRSADNELALIPLEPSTSSVSIAGGPALSNGYSSGFGHLLLLIEHVNICRYKGGPEIPRKVYIDDPIRKIYIVDVYPLCLKLIDGRNCSEKTIRISRKVKWSAWDKMPTYSSNEACHV